MKSLSHFWYVALMRHDSHDYHYHLHAHNRAYPTKSESSQLQVSALKPDVSLAGLARKSNAHTPKPRTPCPFASHACICFGEVNKSSMPYAILREVEYLAGSLPSRI